MDVTKWDEFRDFLDSCLKSETQPEQLFKEDWRERINLFVDGFLKRERTRLQALNRAQKKNLIQALHREGAFRRKKTGQAMWPMCQLSSDSL